MSLSILTNTSAMQTEISLNKSSNCRLDGDAASVLGPSHQLGGR